MNGLCKGSTYAVKQHHASISVYMKKEKKKREKLVMTEVAIPDVNFDIFQEYLAFYRQNVGGIALLISNNRVKIDEAIPLIINDLVAAKRIT